MISGTKNIQIPLTQADDKKSVEGAEPQNSNTASPDDLKKLRSSSQKPWKYLASTTSRKSSKAVLLPSDK